MDVTEQTRAVNQRWWECLTSGDTEGLEALCSDDFRSWSPGRGWIGKAETSEFTKWFRTLLVDGWFTFEEPIVTVEGERACVATSSYARLKNGQIYNNHYHFLNLVRAGKIVESREYNDSLHVWSVLAAEITERRAESAQVAHDLRETSR